MSSEKKPHATINDVAKLANVSIKTVSRVLNREAYVSDKTRERVLAVVADLNYKPNVSARRLAGHRSFLIALLYDNPSPSYLLNVQNGLLEAADFAGFDVLMRPCDSGSKTLSKEIIDFLERTNVDGLVLTPPLTDHEKLLAAINEFSLPVSRIAPIRNINALDVTTDDHDAMRRLTEYVIESGHSAIGFIQGHPDHGATRQRLEGCLDAMKAAGLELKDDLIYRGLFSFESGVEAGRYFLGLSNRPSAIIASNDDMAAGVLQEVARQGLRVPEDISVTGFDDTPLSWQVWPPLTTIHQPIRSLAISAASKLLENLGVDTSRTKSPSELKNSLVLRGSVQRSNN